MLALVMLKKQHRYVGFISRDETITPITRDLLVISMIATRYAVIEY